MVCVCVCVCVCMMWWGLGRVYPNTGEENGNPLQDSCLENPTDRGAWQAIVHGVTKESDTTSQLNNNPNITPLIELRVYVYIKVNNNIKQNMENATNISLCSFIQQIFVKHFQRACTKKGNKKQKETNRKRRSHRGYMAIFQINLRLINGRLNVTK